MNPQGKSKTVKTIRMGNHTFQIRFGAYFDHPSGYAVRLKVAHKEATYIDCCHVWDTVGPSKSFGCSPKQKNNFPQA